MTVEKETERERGKEGEKERGRERERERERGRGDPKKDDMRSEVQVLLSSLHITEKGKHATQLALFSLSTLI